MYERPKGFENERNDCAIITLSQTTGLTYKQAHEELSPYRITNGCTKNFSYHFKRIIKEIGLCYQEIVFRGTLKKFLKDFRYGTFYVGVRGHALAVIEGKKMDLTNENMYVKRAIEVFSDNN